MTIGAPNIGRICVDLQLARDGLAKTIERLSTHNGSRRKYESGDERLMKAIDTLGDAAKLVKQADELVFMMLQV